MNMDQKTVLPGIFCLLSEEVFESDERRGFLFLFQWGFGKEILILFDHFFWQKVFQSHKLSNQICLHRKHYGYELLFRIGLDLLSFLIFYL